MESKVDFASLSLFPATRAQVEESWCRTWPQWGGTLSLTEYLAREVEMESMDHAKDGKFITWVLAPRDDPTTLNFMCSCETFKRSGLVAYPSSSTSEPNSVHEVTCYAIASVFTPPSKRGRGYASHMMSLLHWVIASRVNLPKFPEAWGAPPEQVAEASEGLFSCLYSDVGEDFYRSAGPGGKEGGWETQGAVSTIWDVGAEEGDDNEWTWLTQEQLNGLWDRDAGRIKKELEKMLTSDTSYEVERPAAFVTCLPTNGVCGFHISRSTDIPGLISKIRQAARRSGIGKVEVWKLGEGLRGIAERTGGQTGIRNEHLPQMMWYGPGTMGNIEWAYNEK
ncbi:uncharacterized protein F5891DRAFT_1127199 [Suillus fuscotomentosus]|uniref:LYC1 C-terminal domain-containing protein n=1 Tax=Suillus fuscotomentosus TaxID=1912939 RepID=A0AAD4EC89_9AGAM|nr:uncharacterized protein F5891DRAFT_1127199 [Suillus fuscotomentosus]KAG1903332.1 hypothetical protein F5891DRAFT_1127199 [Suillus fuscotomentosus]